MHPNETIFKELIKRGHSIRGETRIWDISDSKLWYLTPELAEGFLTLEEIDIYRNNITKPEIELLRQNCKKIMEFSGLSVFNFIDLGCGDGTKASSFLKCMPSAISLRYCPVDISPYLIDKAIENVKKIKSTQIVEHSPTIADFDNLDNIIGELRNGTYQNNIIFFLGSTLSTFEVHDFLFKISNAMMSGDSLVIGNGIRQGERFTSLENYKSSFFDKWFINIMKELGFKEEEVEYDARFTETRVEGLYRINVNKKISHQGKNIEFKKGDEVIVAIQYKYFEEELKDYCKMYFRDVEILKDKDEGYCLVLCKK